MRSALALFALVAALDASAAELPAGRAAPIIARILSYDGALKARAGATVDLAIVYRASDSSSKAMADDVGAAFSRLDGVLVQGVPLRVHRVSVDDKPLEEAFGALGIDAAYVCAGLEAELDDVASAATRRRVLTVAHKAALLEKGLAVAVEVIGGKTVIFVNTSAAKAESAQLSSELLGLARIVKPRGG